MQTQVFLAQNTHYNSLYLSSPQTLPGCHANACSSLGKSQEGDDLILLRYCSQKANSIYTLHAQIYKGIQ